MIYACLCSRSEWSPWPWIRTMKWLCRPWNFWCSFLSESLLSSFCFLFFSIFKAPLSLSSASNHLWLLRSSDDVLSPEDYRQLLQFVYSSQRPLAATAGELLLSRYTAHHVQKICKQKMWKTNRGFRFTWMLLEFFQTCQHWTFYIWYWGGDEWWRGV